MQDFPETTFFNGTIPKTKFYHKLDVKPAVRNIFVNEIEKIVWRNKLSHTTLNVQAGSRVHEIQVLEIIQKKAALNESILKLVDKGIYYHILFLLRHDNLYLACMGYKELETRTVSEYYKTGWMTFEELPLRIEGLSLDEVHDNFIRQLNTSLVQTENLTLKEAISDDARRKKIQLQIERLEKKMNLEKQPKRKFELHSEISQLKSLL